jgi:hypothetical protein
MVDFREEGSFWRILRWSKCGNAAYGILRSLSTLILSALRQNNQCGTGFYNYIFTGHRMKFPLASFGLSIPSSLSG